MNPFYWTDQHRMAWLVVSVTGAFAGVLFAYIHSPFLYAPEGWLVLEAWLRSPANYWAWATTGFFATASLFYVAQLGRASN
jgi:hypothetical protein